MEAPKEIYIPLVDMWVEDGGIQPAPIWWKRDKSTEKQDYKGVVKYIRADLSELTWEDIRAICDCFMDAGLHSELPARSKELYKEVLRRFLESKTR